MTLAKGGRGLEPKNVCTKNGLTRLSQLSISFFFCAENDNAPGAAWRGPGPPMGILVSRRHSAPTARKTLLCSISNFKRQVNKSWCTCQIRVFVACPALSSFGVSLLIDPTRLTCRHLFFSEGHCDAAENDCRTACSGGILLNCFLQSISVRDVAPFQGNTHTLCEGNSEPTTKTQCG